MVSSIGWSQFLTWTGAGLAIYALVLVLLFYRDAVGRLLSASPRPGRGGREAAATAAAATAAAATTAAGVPDVMGKPRSAAGPAAGPVAGETTAGNCVNCGHPLPERPGRGTYDGADGRDDERRDERTDERTDAWRPTAPPPYIDVVIREDNVDGYVDLDDLEALIERTSTLVETSRAGAGEAELTQAKRRLAAALAADDLLNSTDFARQVAVTLDREAPTADFSALAELDRQAA